MGKDCVLFKPQALMEFWTIALHMTEVVKRAYRLEVLVRSMLSHPNWF